MNKKRRFIHLPSPPPEELKRSRYERNQLMDIGKNSDFYKVLFGKDNKCQTPCYHNGQKTLYYNKLLGLIHGYKGGDIVMVFFKPHFSFLDLVIHCLRDVQIYVIGITNGIVEENRIPIITDGKDIITDLRLLDPLGGATYPMDCCIIFDRLGNVKNTISWQESRCNADIFEKLLLLAIQDIDIFM